MSFSTSPQNENQSAHDAAWERFKAAERAIKQGDHSPAAQREYDAAGKLVEKTRLQSAGGVFASLRMGGGS